jgi:hypothetical protein
MQDIQLTLVMKVMQVMHKNCRMVDNLGSKITTSDIEQYFHKTSIFADQSSMFSPLKISLTAYFTLEVKLLLQLVF